MLSLLSANTPVLASPDSYHCPVDASIVQQMLFKADPALFAVRLGLGLAHPKLHVQVGGRFVQDIPLETGLYQLVNVAGLTHVRTRITAAGPTGSMTVKAARVRIAAMSLGEPVRALSPADVDFIFRWPDEHFRQRRLFSG